MEFEWKCKGMLMWAESMGRDFGGGFDPHRRWARYKACRVLGTAAERVVAYASDPPCLSLEGLRERIRKAVRARLALGGISGSKCDADAVDSDLSLGAAGRWLFMSLVHTTAALPRSTRELYLFSYLSSRMVTDADAAYTLRAACQHLRRPLSLREALLRHGTSFCIAARTM